MSDVRLVVRENVLPLILPSSAEELQNPAVIRRSLAPGIDLLYAVHAPTVATWFGLTAEHLSELDLADEDALHALALQNLGALELEVDQHDGFAILFCQDLPASSFALRPDLWRDRVPVAADQTPLTWAADPGVLLCLSADDPNAQRVLSEAAAALQENGIVDEFLTPMPWVPGDPPRSLPWAIEPLKVRPTGPRSPEDGPPEEPFALHLILLVVATLGLLAGGIGAWRPLTASLLGEFGLATTALSATPFLIGAAAYALADQIRPALWRGITKAGAWALLGVYGVIAVVLFLLSAADADPVQVGAAVIGAVVCTWYLGGYGAWLARHR